MKTLCSVTLAIFALGASAVAGAADGQIDLLLDPAGSTTISAAGSYVLVDDVAFAPTAETCLQVTASDVTIDLNGHTIAGPGGGSGTSFGIRVDGSNVVIRNGTIRGFGNAGVRNTAGAPITGLILEDIAFVEHRTAAIFVQGCAGLVVRRCRMLGTPTTSGTVVLAGNATVIEECLVEGSTALTGGTGVFTLGDACVVRNNEIRTFTSSSGAVRAVTAGSGSIIEGNIINDLSCPGTNYSLIEVPGDSPSRVSGNVISNIQGGSLTVIDVAGGIGQGTAIVVDNSIESVTATGGDVIGISGKAISCRGNELNVVAASAGAVTGITANERSLIEGNRVTRLTATGGTCTGIALTQTSGSGVAGGIVRGNAIGSLAVAGAAVFTTTGISTGGDATIESNVVSSLSSAAGGCTGVALNSTGQVAVRNNVSSLTSGAGGTSTGILVNAAACHVTENFVSRAIGTLLTDTAIRVTASGDGSIIVGNRLSEQSDRSIEFQVGADNCYYAANIIQDIAILNNGAGNASGTSPAANVVY